MFFLPHQRNISDVRVKRARINVLLTIRPALGSWEPDVLRPRSR